MVENRPTQQEETAFKKKSRNEKSSLTAKSVQHRVMWKNIVLFEEKDLNVCIVYHLPRRFGFPRRYVISNAR